MIVTLLIHLHHVTNIPLYIVFIFIHNEKMEHYSDVATRSSMFSWSRKPTTVGTAHMMHIKKIDIIWMKTIHYLNTIRSHLVTIAPMTPFTPKLTSKLRSALHIRYSIVIPRFIPRANTAQS